MCEKLSPNKKCMSLSVFLDCIDGWWCHLVLQVPLLVFNHMVRTHKSGEKKENIISIINLVLPPFLKSCDRHFPFAPSYRSPTKIPNRDKKTEPIDIVTRKPNLVHPLT